MTTRIEEEVSIDYSTFSILLENGKYFDGTFTGRLIYWMDATYYDPEEGEVSVDFDIEQVYNLEGDEIDYKPSEEDKERIYELLEDHVWENLDEYR